MNKRIYSIALCAVSALILAASNAQAVYYPDNYIGDTTLKEAWMSNDPTNLDVFGEGYDVAGTDVEVQGKQLVVTLSGEYFTTWANATAVATQTTPGTWAPGSLFLNTNGWTPNGDAPYLTDNWKNGTIWNYAITLNGVDLIDSTGHPVTSGTASLYSVKDGQTVLGTARSMQEALFNPNDPNDALANGSWALVAVADPNDPNQLLYELTITMDLPDDVMADLQVLGYHWTQVCANDVFEGAYPLGSNNPVPEPTTMLLFGAGLIGLAGAARRRVN